MTNQINKNIFIVNCEKSVFEESFSRKRNSDIINHYEIKQRLTNNDLFKTPPSNEIVEYQIIKKLNSFRKCKKTEFLFFFTESINENIISGIKSIFTDCEFPVIYHLLVEDPDKVKIKNQEFNSVQKLEI